MDLTAQGPRLLNPRRIRIRCVRSVTKVLRAAEAPVMSLFARFILFLSEPDSIALIDIQSTRKYLCQYY
jgi:hypothetical protein